MTKISPGKKPIVYSCSGCSSSAQMTNYLAMRLDRKGIAEMSCIAGIGGNIKSLVHKAMSGPEIIVIDGCPLACSKACLFNHSLEPSIHFELSSMGVKKKMHEDFDLLEAEKILSVLEKSIANSQEKLQGTSNLDLPGQNELKVDSPANFQVEEVLTPKQMRAFIDFPFQLYRNNIYYVPQIKSDIQANFDKKKNPAFAFCEVKYWLAYREGQVVGRMAGIINNAFNKVWSRSYARFGWLDFVEEEAIASALLSQGEQWARQKGMTAIHGPLGFTNFDYAGMLTFGFEEVSTFATNYNYPYYPEFLLKAGYREETKWIEYKIKVPESVPENLVRVAAVVERRLELKVIRATSRNEILPFAYRIFDLINSSYAGLFGMVPLSREQVEYNIRKYLTFVKPEFVSLVLNKNDELVAFGITMPSLAEALQRVNGRLFPFGILHLYKAFRKNTLADLCLVAVRKDLQGKGVNAILLKEITSAFIRHGIKYAESNPELEENHKVRSMWQYFERIQHKRRSCFIKKL